MLRPRRWYAPIVCVWLACQAQALAQAVEEPPPASDAPSADPTTEEARRLFGEGLEFVEHEDWVQAEERFRRVLVLRGSHVVAYNLASALEHLGRLVEAAELLRPIARDASVEPRTKAAAERLLAEIEPRVGSLTVRLSGDSQGALVRLDDKQVQISEQVLAVSVDPGEHRVVVERDGVVVASRTVQVGDGSPLQVSLAIDVPPRLGGTPPGTTPVPPKIPLGALSRGDERGPQGAVEPDRSERDDGSLFESVWFWAAVGAVAVGAGVTVAVLSGGGEADPVRGDTNPPVVRGRVALVLP